MTQLAIRGHKTRGKEVIQILEMLGGKNKQEVDAIRKTCVYFIDEDTITLLKINQLLPEQFVVFTLEEFEEKFPYKVGDRVKIPNCDVACRVTNMIWNDIEIEYETTNSEETFFADELQPYKEETMEEIKIDIPKGYEFAVVDDDNQQLVFTKIQPQYPKTYEECCKVLNICPNGDIVYSGNWVYGGEYLEKHLERIRIFQKLLICRDAYWKIAGEQMGLGKPFEPDWKECRYPSHCIIVEFDNFKHLSHILAFPTKEIRDAFYQNFKGLINETKELL